MRNSRLTPPVLQRVRGQLFMMGFEGTQVTAQIRELIEKHYIGAILLTAKNLKCATFC